MNILISPKELKSKLSEENLVLLDASQGQSINKLASKTIVRARKINIKNQFSNTKSSFPNTLCSPEQFELVCQKLGINHDSNIVVFDNRGTHWSPRIWWMFRTMEHDDIQVLNGGLPAWIDTGFSIEPPKEIPYPLGSFKAFQKDENVVQFQEVLDNTTDPKFQIVDARSTGRFERISPEPRAHIKSGHIPNSINIHYESVLENGKFKDKGTLRSIFEKAGVNEQLDQVYSCGSGVTACIVMMAAQIVGYSSLKIFDGSWTEWAERQGLFI